MPILMFLFCACGKVMIKKLYIQRGRQRRCKFFRRKNDDSGTQIPVTPDCYLKGVYYLENDIVDSNES
eukprot:2893321-Amphidinium_carterae.1